MGILENITLQNYVNIDEKNGTPKPIKSKKDIEKACEHIAYEIYKKKLKNGDYNISPIVKIDLDKSDNIIIKFMNEEEKEFNKSKVNMVLHGVSISLGKGTYKSENKKVSMLTSRFEREDKDNIHALLHSKINSISNISGKIELRLKLKKGFFNDSYKKDTPYIKIPLITTTISYGRFSKNTRRPGSGYFIGSPEYIHPSVVNIKNNESDTAIMLIGASSPLQYKIDHNIKEDDLKAPIPFSIINISPVNIIIDRFGNIDYSIGIVFDGDKSIKDKTVKDITDIIETYNVELYIENLEGKVYTNSELAELDYFDDISGNDDPDADEFINKLIGEMR